MEIIVKKKKENAIIFQLQKKEKYFASKYCMSKEMAQDIFQGVEIQNWTHIPRESLSCYEEFLRKELHSSNYVMRKIS
ncbi:MAG TPA: hypothetical protein PLP73_01280 [Candidatus Absconditabacterales bacterium]|nr:hypothetical protein [Candidatus Absconditabacterales bacterium]HRU50095.1 hypothetical protein [Candidatus Absconditabacterales bacterium]